MVTSGNFWFDPNRKILFRNLRKKEKKERRKLWAYQEDQWPEWSIQKCFKKLIKEFVWSSSLVFLKKIYPDYYRIHFSVHFRLSLRLPFPSLKISEYSPLKHTRRLGVDPPPRHFSKIYQCQCSKPPTMFFGKTSIPLHFHLVCILLYNQKHIFASKILVVKSIQGFKSKVGGCKLQIWQKSIENI